MDVDRAVTTEQLLRADGSAGPVDVGHARVLRAEGAVLTVLPGVHVARGLPGSPVLRARAVALLVPRGVQGRCVIGGAAAAWVHTGAWRPVPGAVPNPHLVLLLVPRVHATRPIPGVQVRQARLGPDDVEHFGDVPVTTALRTAADLARSQPPEQVTELLEALGRGTGITPGQLGEHLTTHPGTRGVATARAAVEAWISLRESRICSFVDASPGDPVGVEDALHLAHRGDHVPEVSGVAHLEGELADRHAVA